MITTITLNTAMDRTLVVPNFMVARRHRASESITLPGGKGVTIARALKRLGTPVVATGMIGGLTGSNIVQRLTDEGILNDFVRIAEPSRTSTAVIDPMSGVHTEINERGPVVRPAEVELLIEKLRYLVRASHALLMAGTLPREVDREVYQRIIRAVRTESLLTAVVSPDDDETLRASLAAEPSLTIIEQREAESVVGHEFSSDEDFLIALDEIGRMGGQSIVITHATGCHARVKQGRTISWHAASHDPIEAVSELGSTDTFVAGYISALLADRPIDERLSYGLAASLANARQLGAGVFEKGDAVRLQKEVEVRDLEPVRERMADSATSD
jgi:1-phosphofructokinase/tagatose 6-phosphate kinase